MKKVVLILVVVVVLSSFVIAVEANTGIDCIWHDTGCESDYPNYIFYLNQENNAHAYTGGPMTGSNALEWNLCCKNIKLGTNCNEENTIVWLNQNDNAHASTVESDIYNVAVCLEGAICSGSSSDGAFVVGLSQSSNAHLYSTENAGAANVQVYCKLSDEAIEEAEAAEEAKIETGPNKCSNGIDDDGDGFMDCSDDECYSEIGCLNQQCGGTVDAFDEMSITDTMVIWSYILPLEDDKYSKGELTSTIGCCKEDQCAYFKKCVNYDQLEGLFKVKDKILCSKDNNWDYCTYEKLSDSGNYYCDGTKWIEAEINCNNGVDDGGIAGFADCLDPTCDKKDQCEFKTELTCSDGFDNDADLIGTAYFQAGSSAQSGASYTTTQYGVTGEEEKEEIIEDPCEGTNPANPKNDNYPKCGDGTCDEEENHPFYNDGVGSCENRCVDDCGLFCFNYEEVYEVDYGIGDIYAWDISECPVTPQEFTYVEKLKIPPKTPIYPEAIAIPGQQREPSFLRKAWDKVKFVFNRDEAIAGQAAGFQKSSINSCNRKADCNPGLNCINGKCTKAAEKSTNDNCPPGKTCEDPECVGKIVTITSLVAQPKKYLCADKETNCNDGFDNDANGNKDCGDEACDGKKVKWLVGYEIVDGEYDYNKPIEEEAYCEHKKEKNCNDDWDNDGDQVQDCADEDCWGTTFCNVKEGNCQDGDDNDNDGLTDCADHPDCDEDPACNQNACTNDLDDDKDGFTNCWDSQCTGKQGKDFHSNINNYHFYSESGICEYPMSGESLCADGFDNDADGLIDCSDPNCKGKTGSPHQLCDKNNVWGCEVGKTGVCEDYFNEGETSCTDKYDNDGDNLADCYDSDCINTPACQNWIAPNWWGSGVEGTDCQDSDCKGSPGPTNHTCCFNINDCSAGNVCSGNECHETVCSDNSDNDGDGLEDCQDNDCDRLPCGENSKCFSNKCVKKAEAGYASTEEIKPAFSITYKEIFEDLKSSSQSVKGEGDCKTVCENKKSLFGEGADISTCTCIE